MESWQFLILVLILAWWLIARYERRRSEELRRRLPDAAGRFAGLDDEDHRLAYDLVRRSVAEIIGIDTRQVAPSHRLDSDYVVQPVIGYLTLDDPADCILDQLDEYLEALGYPPLPGRRSGLGVAELVASVAEHIKEKRKNKQELKSLSPASDGAVQKQEV